MSRVAGVDQLPGHADAAADLAHAALEYVAHAELASDLLHIDHAPLVDEAGVAGDDEEPAPARERGQDVLGDGIGEIFLVLIAAHIEKRQNRDRRLVGERQCRTRSFRGGAEPRPIDPHRPGDIFELLLAGILKADVDLVAHLLVYDTTHADAAGLAQRFEARRDI